VCFVCVFGLCVCLACVLSVCVKFVCLVFGFSLCV